MPQILKNPQIHIFTKANKNPTLFSLWVGQLKLTSVTQQHKQMQH